MTKLAKQCYYNKDNERKVNCYHLLLSKKVVKEADIEDDDELSVFASYGDIIIRKKYHCTCMECDYEWDSGKNLGIQTMCPKCKVGDVRYEINGGNNDN